MMMMVMMTTLFSWHDINTHSANKQQACACACVCVCVCVVTVVVLLLGYFPFNMPVTSVGGLQVKSQNERKKKGRRRKEETLCGFVLFVCHFPNHTHTPFLPFPPQNNNNTSTPPATTFEIVGVVVLALTFFFIVFFSLLLVLF